MPSIYLYVPCSLAFSYLLKKILSNELTIIIVVVMIIINIIIIIIILLNILLTPPWGRTPQRPRRSSHGPAVSTARSSQENLRSLTRGPQDGVRTNIEPLVCVSFQSVQRLDWEDKTDTLLILDRLCVAHQHWCCYGPDKSLDSPSHSTEWEGVSKLLTGTIHIYVYISFSFNYLNLHELFQGKVDLMKINLLKKCHGCKIVNPVHIRWPAFFFF